MLGICFIAFNCGTNDDDYYGGPSDGGGPSTINIDSFSIYLSSGDDEDSVSFDTILPNDTLLMEKLNFHSQTIRDIHVSRPIQNNKHYFAGAAYAEQHLPQPYTGVVDIYISCDSAVYTSDSIIQAGTNLSSLFVFQHPWGSGKWGDSQDFFKDLRNQDRLESFTMKFPVKLRRTLDQKFTFILIHMNGDSTSAISPRVVAR